MVEPRQRTLDVVRGMAIVAVVLFHLQVPTGIAAVDLALRPFAVAGWAGVDLFFVLSGFLVGGNILRESEAGGFDRRRFFVRRALRLWPALYLYLAALMIVGGPGAWKMVWPVLFHVQNYAADIPSHLWSLAVEEHFYLSAAMLLPMLRARFGVKAVIGGMVAVIVGCGLLRIGALAMGETLKHAQWRTEYRADGLAFGVLIAAVRLYRPASFAAIERRRRLLLIGAVLGFALLAATREDALRYGPGLIVAYLASGALIVAMVGATVPRFLQRPAAALGGLGTIAYSLYLWHASAGAVAGAAMAGSAPITVLIVKLGAAIAVGAILYRAVERPIAASRYRAAAIQTPTACPSFEIARHLQ